MAKPTSSKTVFVCSNCGADYPKWTGKCLSCGEWNTLVESKLLAREQKASVAGGFGAKAINLGDASVTQKDRVSSTFNELDNALGGGLVDDQVVLVSGEPGIGKSTLLLQVAINLVDKGVKCLYVSGEESAAQVKARALRLVNKGVLGPVRFLFAAELDSLLLAVEEERPEVLIVDSVQTVSDTSIMGVPGGMAQVKAVTSTLVSLAKQRGFRLILVGHINKEGEIAGPKVLEHLVDTVVRFEGEQGGVYRVVRTTKNRFGATGEVGILEMTATGMKDVDLVHGVFAGGGGAEVGVAKTLAFEGNRPLVVQVQALVGRTVYPYPKRVAEGLPMARLQLICAIVERYAKIDLVEYDVYVRTAGGYSLDGVAGDLAVAAAIISAYQQRAYPAATLFVGELGLSGRVSLPGMLHPKLVAVGKYGIKLLVTAKDVGSVKLECRQLQYVGELAALLESK